MKGGDQVLSGKLAISQQLQWETRRRVDGLIKIVLVIATVLFLTSALLHFYAPSFTKNGRAVPIMPYTWWLLVGTIVFGVLALYTFALRDYLFGEKLRNNLADYSANDQATKPRYFDELILLFSHIGILSFVLGILMFAYSLSLAATNT